MSVTDVTLPDLVGFETYYGVPVCVVGESGEHYVARGHHEPRTALAAFNAYARKTMDLVDLTDGLPGRGNDLMGRIKQCWSVLKEHCDEYSQAEHSSDRCYECQDIHEAGWWLDWSKDEATAGAFPITVLSF